MKYIGKMWLKRPTSMTKIAEILQLENMAIFKSEDIVGTMSWKNVPILVLLHLSWGDMDKVEKIRVYAHHLDESEKDDFWILIRDVLKDVINEL